ASVARIGELLAVQSRISDGAGQQLPAGALPIAFEGVSFGYQDEPSTEVRGLSAEEPTHSVLLDVSFQLEPGQVLGLLGRTGSGKTTLARLIFRLYDPQGGQITLGGHDLRALRQSQIRRRIGLVTQDIQLFHASVRDNLTFFDPAIADEQIIA